MSKETFWNWLLVLACICAVLSSDGPLGMIGFWAALILAITVLVLMIGDVVRRVLHREGEQ